MIYFIIDGVHILREKVITAVAVILGLVIAFFVYQNFYPEDFMEKDETTITMSDIEKNKSVSYTGHPAGEDIPRISGKEEFEDILAMDDEWYQEHGTVITLIRLGTTFVSWIVIGVVFLLLGEKIFSKRKADY